jgi:hypothetical protein
MGGRWARTFTQTLSVLKPQRGAKSLDQGDAILQSWIAHRILGMRLHPSAHEGGHEVGVVVVGPGGGDVGLEAEYGQDVNSKARQMPLQPLLATPVEQQEGKRE